jgi:hypothetical protein
MDKVILENNIVALLVKKFSAVQETGRLITIFTRARQGIHLRPCVTFRKILFFYGEELLTLAHSPSWRNTHCWLSATAIQYVGPPIVGCTRLLIQYIGSYNPYLKAFTSIRNLRTRHAMVTRDPFKIDK